MNKHVQIRGVADAMHRQLKARAASEGLSISDYVRRLIEKDLKRPSWADFEERAARLKPIALPETTAQMIRRERDAR